MRIRFMKPLIRSAASTFFAFFVAGLVITEQSLFAQCIPVETAKFIASDGESRDRLGARIALSDGILAAGARLDGPGSVYLFDVSTGVELAKLTASDGGSRDEFGSSVALSDGILAVGAIRDGSGSVYLFDVSTGVELAKLTASDGDPGDGFGSSVALSDGILAIGAYDDDDLGIGSGSVYLFDVSTGAELAKLTASDGEAFELFGFSVTLSEGILAVGAHGENGHGWMTGAVYLFDVSTGIELTKLTASDRAGSDYFGFSVSLDDGILAASAIADDDFGSSSGAVYLFDVSTGVELTKLTASDGDMYDSFGRWVSLRDGILAIGANGDDDNGNDAGAVYLFDVSTGVELVKIRASDGRKDDQFGYSVALSSDGILAIGASGDNDHGDDSGSAYVFDITQCPTLTVSPEPLVAGEYGLFESYNLKPNTDTFLFYTLGGYGSTRVYWLGITLDLADTARRVSGMRVTDSTGYTFANIYIPPRLSGRDIWFQACQEKLKTNVVEASVE